LIGVSEPSLTDEAGSLLSGAAAPGRQRRTETNAAIGSNLVLEMAALLSRLGRAVHDKQLRRSRVMRSFPHCTNREDYIVSHWIPIAIE
jgi:hypothetical protein